MVFGNAQTIRWPRWKIQRVAIAIGRSALAGCPKALAALPWSEIDSMVRILVSHRATIGMQRWPRSPSSTASTFGSPGIALIRSTT
jgi:hypothetical protein